MSRALSTYAEVVCLQDSPEFENVVVKISDIPD